MLSHELRIILVFLASFFLTIYILPKLAHVATRIGLLDQPNSRKVHTRPRPLVGGVGMVMAITFTSLLLIPISGLRGYFLGLAILVFVGLLDDFKEIGHRQKFLAQIAATTAMIYFSKTVLSSFGDLLGLGEIIIPGGDYLLWFVTIFCVVGVTNAVNMIDGLDGLAGGVSFIAFLFFAIHAALGNSWTLMLLNLALAGAILGFLRFNWHPSSLFMGDAGSLCLGFSLAFMSLALTQGQTAVASPVTALLVLAVPITDTLIVMFKRVLRGRSPFVADKYHVHHIFLRYGMSREGAVRIILVLCTFMGGLSLLQPAFSLPDSALFGLFALYFTIYMAMSYHIMDFFRYSVKLKKKRAGRLSTDYLQSLFFRAFDIFEVFRKAKRFEVDFGVDISGFDDADQLSGRMLDLSRTGCMVRVKGDHELPEEVTLFFELPCEGVGKAMRFDAEHLWQTTVDRRDTFYGFRFKSLSVADEECLHAYLEILYQRLRDKQQLANSWRSRTIQ